MKTSNPELDLRPRAEMSRPYFGAAISYDPGALYKDLGSPRPSRMPSKVSFHIDREIRDRFAYDETDGLLVTLLKSGVEDTQTFLHDVLHRHQLTADGAMNLLKDIRTLNTLAMLALQPDTEYGEKSFASRVGNSNRYDITGSQDAVTHTPHLRTDTNRGCPFAGSNGEVKMDPLFVRFGQWSGKLAVLSFYNQFGNK